MILCKCANQNNKTKFISHTWLWRNNKKKAYREITDFSQKNNFKVIAVNPDWENSTASDWIKFFLDKVSKNQPSNKDSIVVGFSFGAYIAAIASEKIKFKKNNTRLTVPLFQKRSQISSHYCPQNIRQKKNR